MDNRFTYNTLYNSGQWLFGTFVGYLFQYSLFVFCVIVWLPAPTSIGNTGVGLSAIVIALLASSILLKKKQSILDSRAIIFLNLHLFSLILLSIWGLICLQEAENILRSGRFFFSQFQGIIILLSVSIFASSRILLSAIKVIFFTYICIVAVSLLSLIVEPIHNFMFQGTDRLIGFFKNANQFGMILAMWVPIFLSGILYSKYKVASVILLLATLLLLAKTGSKTNILISIAIMIMVYCYYSFTQKQFLRPLIALSFVVLTILYAGIPVLEKINPRAANIISKQISGKAGYRQNSVYSRTIIWKKSIEIMAKNPLLGQGTGQRIYVYNQNHSHSHNVILDIARTLGVPGLFVIIILLLTSIVLSIQTLMTLGIININFNIDPNSKALLVGLCFAVFSYILSNQMSDSFGPSTSTMYWLTLGLILRRNDIVFGTKK